MEAECISLKQDTTNESADEQWKTDMISTMELEAETDVDGDRQEPEQQQKRKPDNQDDLDNGPEMKIIKTNDEESEEGPPEVLVHKVDLSGKSDQPKTTNTDSVSENNWEQSPPAPSPVKTEPQDEGKDSLPTTEQEINQDQNSTENEEQKMNDIKSEHENISEEDKVKDENSEDLAEDISKHEPEENQDEKTEDKEAEDENKVTEEEVPGDDKADITGKDYKNKVLNKRKNIKEVIDSTQLDEVTLAAQREEYIRLSRVQEQQRQQREALKQIALEKHSRAEEKIIQLLQGQAQVRSKSAEPGSSDEESDVESGQETIAPPKKEIVTIEDSSSDDDCQIVEISDEEPENLGDEDVNNSGIHTNDAYNVPDEQGRVLVNFGHGEDEPSIFLAPQIARAIKPHQIGGVRFLYDNVIESVTRFSSLSGFGCILAHSMGLGKTIQVIAFCDIFLRHTPAKTVLIIMPINTLQNWLAEFDMWLPDRSDDEEDVRPRSFKLFILNESHKSLRARERVVMEWAINGGVLMIGYEMYRLLSQRKLARKRGKKIDPMFIETPEEQRNMFDSIHEMLVNPGPDLVICDEGHRIKNAHASISVALKQIKSRRRIVLTGYPLQNNLLEYWCMVDFVRPNYLGNKTEFSNMFERPIQNGQCVDSTPKDVQLMRYRAHVLHSLLVGFVQRRSHTVLQTVLPKKHEYVLLVRMTDFQRKLYDTFMNDVVRIQSPPNPLKAFAVCCKIWNHPDVLYNFLKRRDADVDLDLDDTLETSTADSKKGNGRGNNAKKKELKSEIDDDLPETKPVLKKEEPQATTSAKEESPFTSSFYQPADLSATSFQPQTQPQTTPAYQQQPSTSPYRSYDQRNYGYYQPPSDYSSYYGDFWQQQAQQQSQSQPTTPVQQTSQQPTQSQNQDYYDRSRTNQYYDSTQQSSFNNEWGSFNTPNPAVAQPEIPPSTPIETPKIEASDSVSSVPTTVDEPFDNKLAEEIKEEIEAVVAVKKEKLGGQYEHIPYDWAVELMKGYVPEMIENSPKFEIFFLLLEESVKLGDRVLFFSQSLLTLSLIEKFLQRRLVPGTEKHWQKNHNYFRLDGSTVAIEREKLINTFNENENIKLFLVSTRAGSLGVNLVGANRVIVFDASWNPCHDTQAVCRVYRYGQEKPCFVYRIVMDACLEKKIYDRQISKQGMSDRVIDECNPDAHLSMKEVTSFCFDDDDVTDVEDFSESSEEYADFVLKLLLHQYSTKLTKKPFHHESLLVDRKEKKLSQAEKRLAKRGYEMEKMNSSKPAYSYTAMGTTYRAYRTPDGTLVHKPVNTVSC